MNVSIRPLDLHPQEFLFRSEIWEYHPQLDYRARVWAKKLILHRPYGEDAMFDLELIPAGTWAQVEDNAGTKVPLFVFAVDPTVVYGRWTLMPGIPTRQPDFMQQALNQLFPG